MSARSVPLSRQGSGVAPMLGSGSRDSQCGKVRLGNFADARQTIGAAVPKKYILD